MKEKDIDAAALGMTYQMSLDAFFNDHDQQVKNDAEHYQQALDTLKEIKRYRSWSKKRAIALEALAICADCVEAYHALGYYSDTIFATLQFYKDGMELATMNLGAAFFQQSIIDFYDHEETHPFFQMKYVYARALFEAGYLRRAQIQFQEIIALHPGDEYHVRYYLFAIYLYFEELEKFRQLFERYSEYDTFTLYANFLYFYKKQLQTEAKAMLPSMKKTNPYLYVYMTREEWCNAEFKETYEPGSEEEAVYCYTILQKVTNSLEYLPMFLVK